MTKFALAVITVIILTVFTIQNIEQVEIQLPFIKSAFRIRLIYLLLTTYVLGCMSTYLWVTARQWKSAKKKKRPEEESLDAYL